MNPTFTFKQLCAATGLTIPAARSIYERPTILSTTIKLGAKPGEKWVKVYMIADLITRLTQCGKLVAVRALVNYPVQA